MSKNLELTFASKEDSLDVRRFSIVERLNGLFAIEVVARSPVSDLDLESIVGHGASFRIVGDARLADPRLRAWTGVCSHLEQLQGEETGLSTYRLSIVPGLWRTTLRTNIRIFQRISIPDIVTKVLSEWEITAELRLSETYPKHEYRVQYMETDFAFVSRMLEEAGISYFFEFDAGDGNAPAKTKLVLHDAPQKGELRSGALPFVDGMTHEGRSEFAAKVRVSTEARAGDFTIRDHDFRLRPDYQLIQEHKLGVDREVGLERYEYLPGSYAVESQGAPLPMADHRGLYKSDEQYGKRRARLLLEAERAGRRIVELETNAVDIAPGTLFTISGHPRSDLQKPLLVTEMRLEGNHDGQYKFVGRAVFTEDVYRPVRATPRPRILGVQSALVVGPPGEEIHTDEFGRVRVQFHWDREHGYDDESSCWIRVSQAWAGLGYGMMNLPRIGQEVLVEFFDGDPDRPVITGRVYNNTSRVPYKLPDDKTKSGWKSDSSPGSNGFNELMFDDKKGAEQVHLQAERDYSEVVKHDQTSTVLNDRSASITSNDSTTVGKSLSVNVGESVSTVVGQAMTYDVGKLHVVSVENGTSITISKDLIALKTSGAAITLSGQDIVIEAQGQVIVRGKDTTYVHSTKEIFVDAPMTYINTQQASEAVMPEVTAVQTPAAPGSAGAINDSRMRLQGRGEVSLPGGYDEASPNAFLRKPPATPADAAKEIRIDPAAAAQIAKAVASGNPIEALEQATAAGLLKEDFGKALTLFKAAKTLKETKGLSLLAIPELKEAVGSVVTEPIIGGLSGLDIADIVNSGDELGIWHVGEGTKSAIENVKQYLGRKTEAAPSSVDGGQLDRDIQAGQQQGMSQEKAQSRALSLQGVAMYVGDLAGRFTKIPTG